MSNVLLKKKLRALNYPTDFPDDAAPTVERLLNDLIKTSEAYQMLKREGTKASELPRPSEKALQNHVTLLERENNELHSRLIKAEESTAAMGLLITKLENENRELNGLVKFFQTGGKNTDSAKAVLPGYLESAEDRGALNDATVSKSAVRTLEAKVEGLEKTNASLKTEVARLRATYEGTINYDVIEQKGRHLMKEQEKEKEEALLSQMEFLTKRNEEISAQLATYKNSQLPQLSRELTEHKTLLREEKERTKTLESLLEAARRRADQLQTRADEQAATISQNANASYHHKVSKDLQESLRQANQDILERDKQISILKKTTEELEREKRGLSERLTRLQTETQTAESDKERETKAFQTATLKLTEKEFEVQSMTHKVETLTAQLAEAEAEVRQANLRAEEAALGGSETAAKVQKLEFEVRKVTFDCEQARKMVTQKSEIEAKLREKVATLEAELRSKEAMAAKLVFEETTKRSTLDRAALLEEALREKETQIDRLTAEAGERETKLMSVEQKCFDLESEFNSKTILCQSLERELAQYSRELQEARGGLVRQAATDREGEGLRRQLEAAMSRLEKTEKAEKEAKALRLELDLEKSKCGQKTAVVEVLEKEVRDLRATLEKTEDQIRADADLICAKEVTITSLGEEIKELSSLLAQKEELIQLYENRTQSTKNQILTTTQGLQEHKKTLAEKDGQIKALEGQLDRLKSQLKELQSNKEELGATLAGKLTREEEEGRLVKGLERETETLRDKNAFLQSTISQLEGKLQTKQTEIDRLTQEVSRLNTLLNNLAAQREEILSAEKNLRTLEGSGRATSEQVTLLTEENQRLREQLGALAEAERNFKSRFAALDAAKDRIQETCDEKTLQVEQLGTQLEKHLKTLRILADEKTKIEQIAHELSFKCTSMESDLGASSRDLGVARDELRVAAERLAKSERDKADLTSDFQILLAQHRTSVNDCMMIAKKVESLEKRLEARQEEIKRRDVECSNLSIEIFQLKNSCKLFEQENFSLKKLLEKAQQSFQDAAKRVKALERELEGARYEGQSMEKEIDALKVELSATQTSYNKAMVEIQSRDVSRLDNDQEIKILRARCETSENISAKLNKELGAREKDLTKAVNERNALQQNFLLVKSKNEELVSKLAAEMKKNAELETSLLDERSRKEQLLVSMGKSGRSLNYSGQGHFSNLN